MDYSKLKGRVYEKYGTVRRFCKEMGWSESTGSNKLKGLRDWSSDEYYRAIDLLDIKPDEVVTYFFTK